MLVSSGCDDLAGPWGNEVSKYPNSRLRRTIALGAAPVSQRRSPSLSLSSSSPTPSSSSSPSPPQSPRRPPSPVAQHHPRAATSWRRSGPASSSPSSQSTDNEVSWAKKGAIGHLPIFLEGDRNHQDSCLVREILKTKSSVEGFFGHPVLILSDPDDAGIVKFFPMTSWDGKTIEKKWEGMGPSKKAAKLGQFRQIAHPGVESTLPELRLRDGEHLLKRTYVNMEKCWEVEESILTKWGLKKDAPVRFLEAESLENVINYAKRHWLL